MIVPDALFLNLIDGRYLFLLFIEKRINPLPLYVCIVKDGWFNFFAERLTSRFL